MTTENKTISTAFLAELEGLDTREFNQKVEDFIVDTKGLDFLVEYILDLANEMHTEIIHDVENLYEMSEEEYLALDIVERCNLFTDISGDFYETFYHEMLVDYVEEHKAQ